MKAVYKRELKAYFTSPLAYVFLFVSMLVSGYFFFVTSILYQTSVLSSYFGNWTLVFMIFVPVLTMRLMAEERKTKTDQILLTSPVSITSVVTGKFFAAMTVVLTAIVLSMINVVIVAIFGKPHYGEVFTYYLGFILMCAAFVSIGILISSLTESQVVAAVISIGIFFLMFTLSWGVSFFSNPIMIEAINYISLTNQLQHFSGGLLNIAPVLYFISITVICLFLTVRVVDRRRWS